MSGGETRHARLTVRISQVPPVVNHHQAQCLGVRDLVLARTRRRVGVRRLLGLCELSEERLGRGVQPVTESARCGKCAEQTVRSSASQGYEWPMKTEGLVSIRGIAHSPLNAFTVHIDVLFEL